MSASSSSYSVTAMSLLYLTILVNFWIQHDPTLLEDQPLQLSSYDASWWGFAWHSHSHTTVNYMIKSLFSHMDWMHVLSNMLLLWEVGRQLFISNDVQEQTWQPWTSPLCFVWIYFGSEVLSVAGCRVISHCLEREWERRVHKDRANWSWGWMPNSVRDAWYTLSNAQQAVELRVWQYRPMIGSSAAVFGVVGAHVYAALHSREHPARMDTKAQFFWAVTIGKELFRTPFSLDQISLLDKEDNIDHASHLCGFVGGFLLALVWDALSRKRKRSSSNRRERKRSSSNRHSSFRILQEQSWDTLSPDLRRDLAERLKEMRQPRAVAADETHLRDD